MKKPDGEKDINDVFDDLLLAEERLVGQGYREGFAEGSKQENKEGFHLGYHRGAEIGAELGYYLGVIENHEQGEGASRSEKTAEQSEALRKLIVDFPGENDEGVDVFGQLERVRSDFRKFCAVLKIKAVFLEPDDLSF